MTKLRIVLAQLNFKVGDLSGNLEKHLYSVKKAKQELSADIIIFPELSLTGYPPEDLLLRPTFINDAERTLNEFITKTNGIYCLVGHPSLKEKKLFNTCSLIYNGKIIAQYHKQKLPNYGVFDEERYFEHGNKPCVVPIKDIPVGIAICEDAWSPKPFLEIAKEGARLILLPNASPFESNKHEQRVSVLVKRTRETNATIVYVNMIGGQDELIFDGDSMVINQQGELCQSAGVFKENLHPVDFNFSNHELKIESTSYSLPSKEERIYQALVLGVRDYIEKNHFPGVLIGVSGGIDSALVLAIAVDALGKDKVEAILMPSRFTADISNEDAQELINNLGVKSQTISIEPAYQALLESLAPSFAGKKPDITEENIQARIRAVMLMALSNKSGKLVLTTGNRSELAVGYCTLYGDMAGGYAPLKDVFKTQVYDLANYRNQIHPVIPKRIIDRPPTAELAFNQRDEDCIPPYPILDKILDHYLNQTKSVEEIIALGFDRDTVIKVVHLIRKNEYKRRQAAIGPHINHKSFGKDWRYPITNGFKG